MLGLIVNHNPAINRPLIARPGIHVISLANSVTANSGVVSDATSDIGHARVRLNNGTPIVVFSSTSVSTTIRNVHAFNFCGTNRSYATTYHVCTRRNVCRGFIRGLNTTIDDVGCNIRSSPTARLKPLVATRRHSHITKFIRHTITRSRVHLVANNGTIRNGKFFFRPAILTSTRRSSRVIQHRIFKPIISIARFISRTRILN